MCIKHVITGYLKEHTHIYIDTLIEASSNIGEHKSNGEFKFE